MSSILYRVFILFTVILFTNSSYATLLAGWDFQTTTNGGTAAVGKPSSPTSYVANFGSGNMYLDGTNGSSTWDPATELDAFSGSNSNTTGTSLSTNTTGLASLALINSAANGKYVVFTLNMTGFTDLVVSYDSRNTSTGFTSHLWEYSSNGTSWTTISTVTGFNGTFSTYTLPTITALNGVATSYLRLTVTGATSTTGNSRLDNIQFNAAPVTPLPVTWGDIKLIDESKTLYWETLSEYNVDYFVVEGSYDAEEFKTISQPFSTVDISHETKTYTHFINESDMSYFRIKEVDIDGTYEYSPIVYRKNDYIAQVTLDAKVVYKNDFSFDYIKIENNTENTVACVIVDALGCVKSQTYLLPKSVTKLNQLDLHLENGMYFLQSVDGSFSEKIIIR